MPFPTISFFIFFVIFCFIWKTSDTHDPDKRHILLIIGSSVFYGLFNPWLSAFLLIYSGLYAYAGDRLYRYQSRTLLWFSCGSALIFLIFAKYFNWFLSFFEISPIWPKWAIPLALSFLTFQVVWSLIQSYDGLDENPSLLSRMAHLSFFPTLTSGPILSLRQWMSGYLPGDYKEGIPYIVLGLFMKLVLASIANMLVTAPFADPGSTTREALWTGILGYTFEIYFDFAGYSFMAYGLAKMLGFNIPFNFQQPYQAFNIQDFWRRWHISLSTFLRDTLYIRLLGGNRKGLYRQIANAFLVMFLCGIWHGANITFLIWGAIHGICIGAYVYYKSRNKVANESKPWDWFFTMAIVSYAWLWFRADTIDVALRYQAGLFISSGSQVSTPAWAWLFLIFSTLFIWSETFILNYLRDKACNLTWKRWLFWSLSIPCILALSPQGLPNFIYYQF